MKNGKSNNEFGLTISNVKSSLKNIIWQNQLFPKITEYLNNLTLIKMKRILNIESFKSNKLKSSINTQTGDSNPEIYKFNFSYETELLAKQYSFYQSNYLYKYVLLSNFFKIFLINVPKPICTIQDFYSLLLLICPDFPKALIIKIYFYHFSTCIETQDSSISTINQQFSKNLNILNNEVDIFQFFITFSVCYYYSDFFIEIEKLFEFNFFEKTVNTNSILIKDIMTNKALEKTNLKLVNLYEIIISCDDKLIMDYNLNTINTLQDVAEILEKYVDITSISFLKLIEKSLKNYNLIKDLFLNGDNNISKLEFVLTHQQFNE